jgi:hypothetical protein
LTMQESSPEGDETRSSPEATPQPAPPKGDFYDDERVDAVLASKPEISNSMREKLINESRGLGADPNAQNPFLYVFGAVGIFVVLGARTSAGLDPSRARSLSLSLPLPLPLPLPLYLTSLAA